MLVHAMARQRMRGVENTLNSGGPIAVLAVCNVGSRKGEIVEDIGSFRPLTEEMIVAEKMVVAEGGMRDDERLHRCRVLLHQIGDARI